MGDTPRRIERNVLTISSEQRDGTHLVRLEGEMDLSNARDVEDELTRIEGRGASRIVLDLAPLEFIDSTGLAVIMRAHQRAANDSRTLGVTRPQGEKVKRIFELYGLDESLPVVD